MPVEIKTGGLVSVQCTVSRGAFPNEYLIRINTKEGEIAGFINTGDVFVSDDGTKHVRGRVLEMEGEHITIKLPGSFFRTTGIALFSREMIGVAP